MTSAWGAVSETGPALFAGTACALFGAALLLWTTVRRARGEPVAATTTVGPATAVALATTFGMAFLGYGIWQLSTL
ncbi:hypothetical protein [Streptomyces alkaliterrae]|uniref:Uncharacterized protein n=1 Tax=Streptomyces alkaliterrae TaxID=2213162 RepID=A0A5P0YNT9_9ACTN|nr:hypothetical protein [Streptomyces alkaliterrae]MBB1253334.1 hypothetical protein [Streptomyces alkaliterrae]MBB1259903.1 hypothetical protein [Streptomyces alkaliterrae]MQS01560.1 hypothetical protein [Streptomyces alkaliterrae]